MRRATEIGRPGNHAVHDTVSLDYDGRYRRRARLVTNSGCEFLLDLPRAVPLKDGDALLLDDGTHIRVVAMKEPLLEVAADSPAALARIAWHLGNRHLPAEIRPGSIRIRRDPVIGDMLVGLGARCLEIEAPFQPEGGAYEHGHG